MVRLWSLLVAGALGLSTAASAAGAAEDDAAAPVAALKAYLAKSASSRPPLAEQPFARRPLSREEADQAAELLVADWRKRIRKERAKEMKAGEITIGKHTMPFAYKVFGEKPRGGRSLYISMHGGGGAPKQVNDQQWENQKRLYEPEEGVYVAPRAPTDNWNLWHEEHIDGLFNRLIENMTVFEDVDPDRVYIMGYSAGGDGVFQLAPRMADRLAAAAMMAGHPNEASPLGLRNIGFTLHMGALDGAYDRNKVAAEWKEKLAKLHDDDPEGYVHLVDIHEGKGHWMDREDAVAVGWMYEFTRTPFPKKIVWFQDDVAHDRYYWLAVDEKHKKQGAEVRAELDGQEVSIESDNVEQLTVRFNDEMLDLDKPVTIRSGDETLFEGKIERSIAELAKTLDERGDPKSLYSGETTVEL
jgi:hypothetical protein